MPVRPASRLLASIPALLLATLALASSPARAASKPLVLERATRVVERWSPSQHLYVKGELGVGPEQLRELELWLTRNAPHWTVVLLESAEGERFVDAEGTAFEGLEAVKHALGKGLSNRTGFGSLRHPETGEQDGAIFLLSLRERDLSYFGSTAQDSRGLGEARWKGELDAPAISAMRNGGRVLDAARDTILDLDRRLASALRAEAAERESRRLSLRQQLQGLGAELEALPARQQALFGGSPPPDVPQAHPDVPGMRERLASALALLEQQPPRLDEAQQAFAALRQRLDEARRDFESYEQALSQLSQLNMELSRLEFHRLRAFAPSELTQAREALEQARPAVLALDPTRQQLLEAADDRRRAAQRLLEKVETAEPRLQALARELEHLEKDSHAHLIQAPLGDARQALRTARQAHQRHEASFLQPLHAGEEATRTARHLLDEAAQERALRLTGVALACVALLLALGWARLGRNARRREALALASQWRTALDEKTHALLELLERTHLVTGHSRQEVEQRYSGLTREHALKLASDVDELFLLGVGASRVLGQAEELLSGGRGPGWLVAQLSARPFERARRLLHVEPIRFHPDEGIELVLRGQRTAEQRLIGERSSYQPFSLSFEALIQAFNERAARALEALRTLEEAPPRARQALDALERLIGELRAQAPSGPRPSVLLEHVLPALEAVRERALPLAGDPLTALDGPLVAGQRLHSEAMALREVLATEQAQVRPAAARAAEALVEAGLAGRWVDEALEALGRQADAVARELSQGTAKDSLQALAEAGERLRARAAEAEALTVRAGQARGGLRRLPAEVQAAREELGRALVRPPESVLREGKADPSALIASGEEALARGQRALERGELEAAREGLEAALARVAEADAVLAHSLEAHARFAARSEACRAEARRLGPLAREGEALLGELVRDYLPAALRLGAGDETHPHANGTVRDNILEVGTHLKEAQARLEAAGRAFSEARLLESADLLRQAEAHHALGVHRLEELRHKARRLRELDEQNTRQLAATEALATACLQAVSDVRTSGATQAALSRTRKQLQQARDQVDTHPSDPLRLAELLAQASQGLTQVRQDAGADLALHARLEEDVKAAQQRLEQAQALSRQSEKDGLPDSQATTQARGAVARSAQALESARRALRMPHGDWSALEARVEQLDEALARESASLRGELEAVRQASEAIRQASDAVKGAEARIQECARKYSQRVGEETGAARLGTARRALQKGDYAGAQQAAREAEGQARKALAQAERLLEQRERQEREAREAEARRRWDEDRRRREETESSDSWLLSGSSSSDDDSRSSSSSSLFGSSGGSSSGSGFSSSSWTDDSSRGGGSSSGSGFGSSGW